MHSGLIPKSIILLYNQYNGLNIASPAEYTQLYIASHFLYYFGGMARYKVCQGSKFILVPLAI